MVVGRYHIDRRVVWYKFINVSGEVQRLYRAADCVSCGQICTRLQSIGAVLWMKRLGVVLSPRRPGCNPGPIRVAFIMDDMAQGQVVFYNYIRFSFFVLHIHSSFYRRRYKPAILVNLNVTSLKTAFFTVTSMRTSYF